MTIRKSVTVRCAPDQAFRVFTREIGRWWPLERGFSYGRERAHAIFLDDRAGGRLYERFTDGTEFEIGRVIRCDPPHLIVFTWKSPDWEAATEVEVRFAAAAEGTRVDLEHRGWEAGPKMREGGEGFARGWDTVLAQYVGRADESFDSRGE
ncbi:MAG TPA: SRPBCC domain-containing protein [Stellaceae bacterium]|nr:SRPBCC domain-containing protein [Stellaceae bacterium]